MVPPRRAKCNKSDRFSKGCPRPRTDAWLSCLVSMDLGCGAAIYQSYPLFLRPLFSKGEAQIHQDSIHILALRLHQPGSYQMSTGG